MKRKFTLFAALLAMTNLGYSQNQNALNFDGTNDYVTIPNEADYDFTTNMTIEFWLKSNNFGNLDGLVTKGDNSWRVHTNPGGQINFTANGAFPDFSSTTQVNDNTWHHVATTYDGTSAKIYIDGVLENTTAATGSIDNSTYKVAIGTNLQYSSRAFDGTMDEVRIWNVARTNSEINSTMNTELVGNETGLVSYYNFNSGIANGNNSSFITLNDLATSANNGVLTNFSLVGTTSNWVGGLPLNCNITDQTVTATSTTLCAANTGTTITTGTSQTGINYYLRDNSNDTIVDGPVTGSGSGISLNTGSLSSTMSYNVYSESLAVDSIGALEFTGNTGTRKVSLGNTLWLDNFVGTNQLTVEAWVNRSTTGSLHTVLGNYNGTFPLLFRIDGNKIKLYLNSNAASVASTTSIPTGTWTHLAGTYDGSNIKIYVNGVLEATTAYSASLNTTNEAMKIGGGLSNGTEYFPGKITDVRFWNVARTQTEIAASMNSILNGSETGLIANYQFNEGIGVVTANSATGNLYPGTLINSPIWTSGPLTTPSCFLEMTQTATVTVLPAKTGNNNTAICANGSVVINGTTYDAANSTGTEVFTNIGPNNCDSTVTVNLTILPEIVEQTVTATTSTLCSNNTGTTITTNSSQAGSIYYLRDNTNDAIVDGPLTGTGNSLSFNTGTLANSTTYNVYTTTPDQGALDFDGVNDYVDAGAGVSLVDSSFTIEFWTKRNATSSGDNYIIGHGTNTASNQTLHIGFRSNNDFTFAFFGNDLDVSGLSDANWHHWAVTFDTTTKTRVIYRDGISVANDISGSNSKYLGVGNLSIGKGNFGSSNYAGSIEEVRVWSVSRTQAEIQSHMNTCLTGAESHLLAYYQFKDGTGSSTLTDLTGNGNNGTLTNMDPSTDWVTGYNVCPQCNLQMSQLATVTVLPAKTGTNNTTICANGSVVINGTTYDAANPTGTEVFTNVGPNNCDSTVTVALNVLPAKTGTNNTTICANGSVVINGTTYDAANPTGTEVFTNVGPNNCDSTVTVNLTINNAIDTSVTNNSPTLMANATGGATYQWIDCNNNNAVIAGATDASYTATVNGSYAVTITVGSCTDTSACIPVLNTAIQKNSFGNQTTIYPNPNNGIFMINIDGNKNNSDILVIDELGQTIYQKKITSKQAVIKLDNFENGFYFIKITNGNQTITKRIVKQ